MSVEVIAEIGVNHNNNRDTAIMMIGAAMGAGANVVKFQASTVREEVSLRAAPEHYAELEKLVPTLEFLGRCKEVCDAQGVEFLCTPAGEESLDMVRKLGVRRIKVASDNLNNIGFLRAVARTHLPVILSTGMGTLAEVSRASALVHTGQRAATLLHCVSAYPCPVDQINLGMMTSLRRYGPIGLSDHTTSVLVPALAVALGAVMIEKHITLDRSMPGPDHAASLTPEDLKSMVRLIREAEKAPGLNQPKMVVPAERPNMARYRKSLVAATDIAEGEIFTLDNVTAKRPGTGRSPAELDSVIGTVARRPYKADELL